MDDSIISNLQCPISGSKLCFMDQRGAEQMRRQIRNGGLRHLDGSMVQIELEAALCSEDGKYCYPVLEGILVLVPSLAIVRVEKENTINSAGLLAASTASVMRFYDEIGWQKNAQDIFEDARRFEDLRAVSATYIHSCHMRVNQHIRPRGKYFLDVASGPLQYDEYLTYSQCYNARICGDISFQALRAAKEKLGNSGVYIQCDITRLPLRDASVDSFVSLHTIYHVPEEKQLAAFFELERVLVNGGTGVVVYSWGRHCVPMRILTTRLRPIISLKSVLLNSVKWLLRKILPQWLVSELKRFMPTHTHSNRTGDTQRGPTLNLYAHFHNYAWFRANLLSRPTWHLGIWRSVSVPFLRRYIRGRLGTHLLSLLFRIEETLPRFMGRYGQYPMFICKKR